MPGSIPDPSPIAGLEFSTTRRFALRRGLFDVIRSGRRLLIWGLALGVFVACSSTTRVAEVDGSRPFTIAVIPDTQNAIDYKHQKSAGFVIDSDQIFIEQMRAIAARSPKRGGDIVFVASVGDVWQHQSLAMDEDHRERGFEGIENPYFALEIEVTEETRGFEIPKAIEGYRILSEAGIPFGVAPGNHDYDAMWSAAGYPPDLTKPLPELKMTAEDLGILHIGGLDNFRSAFGDESDFFKGRAWYVDSFRGGASSAQTFRGGGYTFLHIALEMQADDEVLAWASGVIERHPGLPTIITTHDYLDGRGERRANPIVDLERVDPLHHNSAEHLWKKLIRGRDQIFLVLCGHHHGHSRRVDLNRDGHSVYQILADYQDRGQAGLDAGQPLNEFTRQPVGIGDGWLRLMTFDLAADVPVVRVTTYSPHYESLSSELSSYAAWYKQHENPGITDSEFHATDEFELELTDFRQRFGSPQ